MKINWHILIKNTPAYSVDWASCYEGRYLSYYFWRIAIIPFRFYLKLSNWLWKITKYKVKHKHGWSGVWSSIENPEWVKCFFPQKNYTSHYNFLDFLHQIDKRVFYVGLWDWKGRDWSMRFKGWRIRCRNYA